jgi:AcrR family transcriptional regulator
MARPKEFDHEKALRKAIRLFSQQGFAATSTDELMRVMDVGRQSMYDTFGDKRALFLKALKLYVAESVHSINVELERPGSALSAVQKALVTFAERKDLSRAERCMGLNAISEFGQRDAFVTLITRNAARVQRQTLMRVLTKAKKQKELSSDADLDSMANFFESTLAGIRMAAKAGKSRQALRNIAAFAGRAYMGLDCRVAAARLRSNEKTETIRNKARILLCSNGKNGGVR